MKSQASGSDYFRLTDIFIVIVFLLIAVFSVDMFRRDLLQTFNLQNVEPVGTVVIKKNTVQRRISDRVLWDRLADKSPVYIGDLIRVAEISSATLYIDDNSIDLDENTLIRISRSADGEGLHIVLSEGAISLAAGTEGKSVSLDLNGTQVQAGRGTVLSAGTRSAGGISVQVNGGNAQIVEAGGTVRAISSGSAIAVNAQGIEQPARAAVVTQPAPNARYVNPAKEPLTVNFSWNRVNLASDERLRLEIASNRNFTRVSSVIENLDTQAQAQINTGLWYWRLLFGNTVLTTGRLTVADGSGPELQSPAFNSLFRNRGRPIVNFQWTRVQEAVSYIVEVSGTSDFANPQIRRQSFSSSMTIAALGEGTWFWRVMPVFPSVFSGSAAFSTPSFFRIEQISAAPSRSTEEVGLSQWLAGEAPSKELPPGLPLEFLQQFIKPPESPQINLSSPAQGAQIAGLTALRQQTVFRWNTGAQPVSSRFVLSRNADPLLQPAQEISNPDRVIRIDSLAEGTWYWTVEIQTRDGVTASAPPSRLQVLPIPLLPAPRNLRPAAETSLGLQELRSQRTIVFNWSTVQGANAYIFTLYQQTTAGRRQIVSETINSTSYTFTDLRLLDRGTFVWQVEAVNSGRTNAIEQRGTAGESTFIIDFPSSAPLQIEGAGVLYGN